MIYFSNSEDKTIASGQIGDKGLKSTLNSVFSAVYFVQADCDELIQCGQILGRTTDFCTRVYTFVGDNAKEIALNWF